MFPDTVIFPQLTQVSSDKRGLTLVRMANCVVVVVVSNTATTAMMFPVAQAVLDQFERGRRAADRNGQLKTPNNDAIDGHVNDGE